MKESSLSRGAQTTLAHGEFLYNEAKGLYLSEGLVPPKYVALVSGDGETSLHVGTDENRRPVEAIRDRWDNWVGAKLLGREAVYGLFMHLTEKGFDGEPVNSYFVRNNRGTEAKRNGDFGIAVFEPTGTYLNGLSEMQIVEGSRAVESAEQFIDRFRSFSPNDILVLQNGELSDKEHVDSVRTLFANFDSISESIAKKVGTSKEAIRDSEQSMRFRIDESITVDLSARYECFESTQLGRLMVPFVDVWVSSEESNKKIHMSACNSSPWPILSNTGKAVMAGVADFSDETPHDEKLPHDDILYLVEMVGTLAEAPDNGRLVSEERSFTEDLADLALPVTEVGEKNLATVKKLFGL